MPELREAFERVVGSSGFILGTEVEAFEDEFAAFCGVEHCVGVASGTAAIGLALRAAGIGAGDEVIVPGHTFIASALGVLHAGATPVFADVEDDTGLLDPRSAAEVITPRTAAVMAVHLYGQVCDMRLVRELARRHGLFVLEDAAQAHGAADGGHLGQRCKGDHVSVGANERLDGLQAAFLRVKLSRLHGWNQSRRSLARAYDKLIRPTPSTRILSERPGSRSVYHLYPIRIEDRDTIVRRLNSARIATAVHYDPAVHRHPAFDDLPAASRPISLPVADAWAAEELSLPMAAELTVEEVRMVVQSLSPQNVAILASPDRASSVAR